MSQINLDFHQLSLLPWDEAPQDKLRLTKSIIFTATVFILVLIIGSVIDVPKVEKTKFEKIPERIARLLIKKKIPVEKVTINAKATQIKKKVTVAQATESNIKKNPTTKQIRDAKITASRSGILALSSQLAVLRDMATTPDLSNTLKKSHARSAKQQQDLVSQKAKLGSGGLKSSKIITKQQSSLKQAALTRIKTPIDAQTTDNGSDDIKQRSLEEITMIFDQYKSSFYSLYRRAARKQLGLQGKIVFGIKILPNGRVAECVIISSDLKHLSLERKLILRIKQMNFGAKDVEIWNNSYHIDFSLS